MISIFIYIPHSKTFLSSHPKIIVDGIILFSDSRTKMELKDEEASLDDDDGTVEVMSACVAIFNR